MRLEILLFVVSSAVLASAGATAGGGAATVSTATPVQTPTPCGSPAPSPSVSSSPQSPSPGSTPTPGCHPPPSPTPTPDPPEGRTVGLRLKGHLVATGRVASFAPACFEDARVRVQRRFPDGWSTAVTVQTDGSGAYKAEIPDQRGRYRAVAPSLNTEEAGFCPRAVSPVKRHRH